MTTSSDSWESGRRLAHVAVFLKKFQSFVTLHPSFVTTIQQQSADKVTFTFGEQEFLALFMSHNWFRAVSSKLASEVVSASQKTKMEFSGHGAKTT